MKANEMRKSELSFVSLAGNYHDCKPLFVSKGEFILCVSGSVVRKISSKTGEHVGSFTLHTGRISSLRIMDNSSNSSHLVVSSSVDGEIIVWNHKNMEEVIKFQINSPVLDVFFPRQSLKEIFAYESSKSLPNKLEVYLIISKRNLMSDDSKSNEDASKCKLIIFDLIKQKIRRKIWKMNCCRQMMTHLTIGQHKHEYLLTFDGSNVLIWNTDSKNGAIVTNGFGDISCLCSNNEGTFITGHEKGEIAVWFQLGNVIEQAFGIIDSKMNNRNSSENGKPDKLIVASHVKPICTKIHWHSKAVECLALNEDSTYLYSGGEEGVLVLWHLSSQSKTFIPRLGSDITFIEACQDDSNVAVTTSDNAVHFISTASMKEEWCLQSIMLTSDMEKNRNSFTSKNGGLVSQGFHKDLWDHYVPSVNNFECRVQVDPSSNYLFSNGAPGKLQIFDPECLSLKQTIPVVPFVRVSKKEVDSILFLPNVTRYAIMKNVDSDSPSHVVTIDVYRGEDLDPVTSLKFWYYYSNRQEYSLVSQMDFPHGNATITDIAFGNICAATKETVMCCTCDDLGKVKMWRLTMSSDNGNSVPRWHCWYSFQPRECPIQAITFSHDNSLLAIAMENIVTLWDPIRISLKCTIPNLTSNTICQVSFVEPQTSSNCSTGKSFLVIGTKRSVVVVDLLSLSVVWCALGRFTSIVSCLLHPDHQIDGIPRAFLAIAIENASNKSDTASLQVEKKAKSTLLFMDINDARVFHQQDFNSTIRSICFRHSRSSKSNFPVGVFVLSDDGDFGYCGVAGSLVSSQLSSRSERYQRILPTITSSELFIARATGFSNDSNATISSFIKSDSWLREFLDENSTAIPSVSSFYDGLVSKVFQQCKSIPSTNDRAVLSNQDGTGFDVDESSFSIGFNSNENQVQFNDAEGNNRKKDEREEIYGKENYLTMIEESAMAPETFPDEASSKFEANLAQFFKNSLFSVASSNVNSAQKSKNEISVDVSSPVSTPKKSKKARRSSHDSDSVNMNSSFSGSGAIIATNEESRCPTSLENNEAATVVPVSVATPLKRSSRLTSVVSTPMTAKKSSAALTTESLLQHNISKTDSLQTSEPLRRSTRKRSNSAITEEDPYASDSSVDSTSSATRRSARLSNKKN